MIDGDAKTDRVDFAPDVRFFGKIGPLDLGFDLGYWHLGYWHLGYWR